MSDKAYDALIAVGDIMETAEKRFLHDLRSEFFGILNVLGQYSISQGMYTT